MKNLPYIIAAIVTIFWVIGFFVLHMGVSTHLLLVIAGYLLLVKTNQNKKPKHVAFKPMQLSLRS